MRLGRAARVYRPLDVAETAVIGERRHVAIADDRVRRRLRLRRCDEARHLCQFCVHIYHHATSNEIRKATQKLVVEAARLTLARRSDSTKSFVVSGVTVPTPTTPLTTTAHVI